MFLSPVFGTEFQREVTLFSKITLISLKHSAEKSREPCVNVPNIRLVHAAIYCDCPHEGFNHVSLQHPSQPQPTHPVLYLTIYSNYYLSLTHQAGEFSNTDNQKYLLSKLIDNICSIFAGKRSLLKNFHNYESFIFSLHQ